MVLGGVPPDDLAHRIATAKAEAARLAELSPAAYAMTKVRMREATIAAIESGFEEDLAQLKKIG